VKDQDGFRIPKVGDELYSSCAGQTFGTIVAMGKDDNGADTLDVEIDALSINEILHWQHDESWLDGDDMRGRFGVNPLTHVDAPIGMKLTIKKLQWRSVSAESIETGTPDGGCNRCCHTFFLKPFE
jgi:hypothetical protein